MGALLWLLLLFVGFVAALASSAKLRKNAFIWFWFSYVTITGWYYCRVLHKKYAGNNDNNKEAPERRRPDASGSVERRQHAEQDGLERSGVSERSSHMSDSGSSGGSDEAMRRVSDASSADLLTNSGVSDSNGPVTPTRNSATRRTYTGRKKPESWAD
ncbi:hypothetical protein GQ600_9788 [Phytophthora cactorum]|nr:hypothetical protein GQ600_9788 [Phytophthora cactorum]